MQIFYIEADRRMTACKERTGRRDNYLDRAGSKRQGGEIRITTLHNGEQSGSHVKRKSAEVEKMREPMMSGKKREKNRIEGKLHTVSERKRPCQREGRN